MEPEQEAANLRDLYPDSIKNDKLWMALGAEGRHHFETLKDTDDSSPCSMISLWHDQEMR